MTTGAGSALRVSVVVPTYRRPELLTRCLAALGRQDLPPSRYEVVVADDGGGDAVAVVERAARDVPMLVRCVVVTGRRGPAAARNTGWRAARGPIIAFTDDDCVPEAAWLSAGLAAFAADVGRLVGVQGRVLVPRPRCPTDHERNTAGLEDAEFVTANCFCRRDALEAVGGFDETFPKAWREDSDLFFTLLERGGRFARAPRAVVIHPVRAARWGVSIGEQRKSMYNALLYKKHPMLYRERIQRHAPWTSYATAAALLCALGAGVGGFAATTAVAGGVWTALTARVCRKRLTGTAHTADHVAEMIVTSALIPSLSVFWRLRGALRYRVVFF